MFDLTELWQVLVEELSGTKFIVNLQMAGKQAEGYHPQRSRIGGYSLTKFVQAPITGDLKEVPGVGPAVEANFKANGITTTYQLIAKYLSFKDEGVESVELADRFFYWLTSIKTPGGHRSGIVCAIATKVNYAFPGIYVAEVYGELDEDT